MRLRWDESGTRKFETGVDHGVLYFFDEDLDIERGVSWNGLISVDDTSEDSASSPVFLDGIKTTERRLPSDYSGKIAAFTYPDEFDRFCGVIESDSGIDFLGQETLDSFGLSYRTRIGNDLKPEAAYKIHLLYNLTAKSENPTYSTVSETVTPVNFAWSITGLPEHFLEYRPTSHVVINSQKVNPTLLQTIENILYGLDGVEPRMPTPVEFNDWL